MHDVNQIRLGRHHGIDVFVSCWRLVDHFFVLPTFPPCRRLGVVVQRDPLERFAPAHHPASAMRAGMKGLGFALPANDRSTGSPYYREL